MCTVTVVPIARGSWREWAGYRLACNRDEQRSRSAALPPESRTISGRRVRMPIDPASGGTWIAVRDDGLSAALLNVNPAPAAGPVESGAGRAGQRHSRGLIVPWLMECASAGGAFERACRIAAGDYPPFRVVLSDRSGVYEVRSDGRSLQSTPLGRPERPILFTSSGLGDAVVEGPRRELFDRWFSEDAARWPSEQDAFHRHRWADRPHLSVCMSRSDARTVSHTVVEVAGRGEVSMVYHGQWPSLDRDPSNEPDLRPGHEPGLDPGFQPGGGA